ncbi:MAG: hypothetical protein QGH60_14255 [Phycisphaerae bacterium]|jgi:hypothetical protein|nr:hypothetical protein [Phycisphaerae bacterium]
MNKRILAVTVMLASVVVTSVCLGAEPAIKPASILKVIPSGASYYAVNDVSKTALDVEKFLNDIGVGPMLGIGQMRPGDGRAPRSMLLDMLKTQLKLGKGFDPAGGAAVVMLDPSSVGADLIKRIDAARGKNPKPVDYFNAAKFNELVVVVLPGRLEGLFVGVERAADGKLSVMNLNGKKVFACQKGQYVIISPTKKAVVAVQNAKRNATADLSKDELDMVGRGNVIGRYNGTPFRSFLTAFLNDAEKTLKKEFDPATAAGLGVYVSIARGLITQLDSVTVAMRLGRDGINIDSISATRVGSTAAEVMQAESGKSGGAKVLDSLPSMPYVIAVGVKGWMDNKALSMAMLDLSQNLMGTKAMVDIDKKTKARLKANNEKMAGMVTGIQVVIGGAPQGKGMVTMGYVIRCKDSTKYRKATAENIALSKSVLKKMNPVGDMNYVQSAETIDGLSIDAVDITMDARLFGPEAMNKAFKMALGEEKFRMRIVTPDSKTMVMTIGGSKTFLRKALQVAVGAGPIPKMPGTIAVMKHLPKDSTIVSLFNLTNLLDVVRTGMLEAEAPARYVAMVPALKCKTPVAFGAKAKGTTLRTGLFIPKPLVKESVEAVMRTIARFQEEAMKRQREMERALEESDRGAAPPGNGDF